VLLDEIDARRGQATRIDEIETTPVRSPRPTRGMRIAAAAGAFVLVLAGVGVIGLIANSGGSEVGDTPPTQATGEPTPTIDAVSVAKSFYTAFLTGDWDTASELAQGVLISGQNVNEDELAQGVLIDGENGYLLWEIDVVGIDCELVTEFAVSCTAKHTDAVTRQIGAAYAEESVGSMKVVDGVVTRFGSERQYSFVEDSVLDQVLDRYDAWLDDESPDHWEGFMCSSGGHHGGHWAPACTRIYVANVEAWLATDPDLSDIEG
jgi:hypothetical protein